ncbi:hypothetical protein, partial [Escherichia coli]|uniref:hypothetical protein n=1 Tax=Escherichia coli TaxID=562 RepID=UPI00201CED8F
KKLIMLPSETMIWQPEFTDKTLSRKPGAVQVTLTRYEWDIYYLYFKIDNKRILHTLLKKDVKYISHYKISVFNKFEIACDSDGFYIFKALIQLRRFTGFKNVRLYQLH